MHYSCRYHYIYVARIAKLVACLLVYAFLFQACQEVNEDFVFELVKNHYPDCQREKPKVVHVKNKKVKTVDGTETRGLYLPALDMILLSEDADLTTLVHEYRHACGDFLGEKIILPKLKI